MTPAHAAGAAGRWHAVHVYLHDFARLTHFLQTCSQALGDRLDGRCFFVRYWLGGPHLRFRVTDAGLAADLEQVAARYWATHAFVSTLEPDSFYRAYASQLHTEPERGWHANGSVLRTGYTPETARYGGPAGMPLCEREFVSDSAVLLGALARESQARIEKILFGYCLAYADALARLDLFGAHARFACGTEERSAVRRQIALRGGGAIASLRAPLLAAHAGVIDGTYFPAYLVPLRRRLDPLLAGLAGAGADLAAVCASLLHMSFNRAGIAPAREAAIRLHSLYASNEVYA